MTPHLPAIKDLPVRFDQSPLVPAVAQDAETGAVLMVAFMNEDALRKTLETGLVHYWSRSRNELWQKGATSGNVQHLDAVYVNCDQNSLLLSVRQVGAVCHDGYPTCYYRRLNPDGTLETIADRWFDPNEIYGASPSRSLLTKRWYGAYRYLKEHDLSGVSGTSKRLRDSSSNVGMRVADELEELAGVLDGTHVHRDPENDIVLEGSQTLYWLGLSAIRQDIDLASLHLDRAFARPEQVFERATAAKLLRAEAERWRARAESAASAEEVHAAATLVAQSMWAASIDPWRAIEYDLEELRAKPYLAPYFAQESDAD